MTEDERSKRAIDLLARAYEAMYSTLCESNGISDNEWHAPDGIHRPEYPVPGWVKAMKLLNSVYEEVGAFLEPDKAVADKKWRAACTTASAIRKRYEADLKAMHPNMAASSLHRNIADAINGTLKSDDGEALGPTMADKLAELVANGTLHELKPLPTPAA